MYRHSKLKGKSWKCKCTIYSQNTNEKIMYRIQSAWCRIWFSCSKVCSKKMYTKPSSNTLLHLVYFFRNRRCYFFLLKTCHMIKPAQKTYLIYLGDWKYNCIVLIYSRKKCKTKLHYCQYNRSNSFIS